MNPVAAIAVRAGVGQRSARRRSTSLCATILSLVALIGGCAGGSVVLETTAFPAPAITPLPLNAAVYYPDAFGSYSLTEEIERHGSYELNVGPAQVALFDAVGAGMFAGFTRVTDTAPDTLANHDLLIVPAVTALEFAVPANNTKNFFEIRISYRIEVLTTDGRAIDTVRVIAYGKSRNLALDTDTIALRGALHTTLRDAGADFILKFSGSPAIRTWLAEASVAVPESWPEVRRRR